MSPDALGWWQEWRDVILTAAKNHQKNIAKGIENE